jgi:hypothetical protein
LLIQFFALISVPAPFPGRVDRKDDKQSQYHQSEKYRFHFNLQECGVLADWLNTRPA